MTRTTSTSPDPGVSTNARALAKVALKAAHDRGYKDDDAVKHARKQVWDARWRCVLAGKPAEAQAYLDALAQLGDQGGLVALANRAKTAVHASGH